MHLVKPNRLRMNFILFFIKYVQLRGNNLNSYMYFYKSPSTLKVEMFGSQHLPTLVGVRKYIEHAVMLRNNNLSP